MYNKSSYPLFCFYLFSNLQYFILDYSLICLFIFPRTQIKKIFVVNLAIYWYKYLNILT